MAAARIFFVGSETEVGHHAAPLAQRLDVQIVTPSEVCKIAQPGELAIFYSEHFDRFREAICQLKERQVATLNMIDGILEWRNAWENRPDEPACPFTMRPVLCHKVACIGGAQARVLASWGNLGKIEVTGIPRFDGLTPLRSSSPRPRQAGPFRILVMTAKVPGFTPKQVALTRKSLIDLKNWFENRSSNRSGAETPIEVIWRLTAGLDRDIGVSNQAFEFSGKELLDQLAQVDAVISTPSTGMLEAMLLGLPVASLDYHHTPCYLPTAWTIHHAGCLEQVVAELMDPPAAKRHFQQMQLADSLACSPANAQYVWEQEGASVASVSATDRVVQLIDKMQGIAKEQVAQQRELNFPAQLLPPLSPPHVAFDHQEIYADYPEFSLTSANQMQVQLAHSRREISHLQRQLVQLQSELDLAHSIFDQIHKHPVAGPIVRIRQRLLNWFPSSTKLAAKPSAGGQ